MNFQNLTLRINKNNVTQFHVMLVVQHFKQNTLQSVMENNKEWVRSPEKPPLGFY